MKSSLVSRLMSEHIPMPGCPQLIVTRGDAWQLLTDLGYDQVPRSGQGQRFDTVDYMVMNRQAVDMPLSDADVRDAIFAAWRQGEKR